MRGIRENIQTLMNFTNNNRHTSILCRLHSKFRRIYGFWSLEISIEANGLNSIIESSSENWIVSRLFRLDSQLITYTKWMMSKLKTWQIQISEFHCALSAAPLCGKDEKCSREISRKFWCYYFSLILTKHACKGWKLTTSTRNVNINIFGSRPRWQSFTILLTFLCPRRDQNLKKTFSLFLVIDIHRQNQEIIIFDIRNGTFPYLAFVDFIINKQNQHIHWAWMRALRKDLEKFE